MATKAQPVPPRIAPRLYLATPPVADPSAMLSALPDVLAAADIAAVLLKLVPADERSMIQCAKALAPIVQNAGAAFLIDEHFGLAARAGADGANIRNIAALDDALATLKPARIIGVGGLQTRHDAMVSGEAGADYVLFGEPNESGNRPAADAIVERLQWWSEIFEVPCVGFAESLDECGFFTQAGADFILVGDAIWQDGRGPRAAIGEASRIIRENFDRTFGSLAMSER